MTIRPEAPARPDIGVNTEFWRWVTPHFEVMRRVAARSSAPVDVDDVVHDAVVQALAKWSSFDPDKGLPQAWLAALTLDQARRQWRRRGRAADARLVPSCEGVSDVHLDVDLERALRRLPTRQRQAVELYYFVGLSTADVAAVMGCSVGTVKSTLFDARKALAAHLGEG